MSEKLEKLERITFSTAQAALLEQLCNHWTHTARGIQADAAACSDVAERGRLNNRALHYLRNADQLRGVFSTGNLPEELGIQVRASV
jgi:hypothetical protein